MNLAELSYYQTIGKKSKLVYSEGAARAINGLIVPAYRFTDSQGQWPAIGQKPKSVHAFAIIQCAAHLAEEGQSKRIPALTLEEEALAQTLLAILAYAGGRNIDLGRAAILVHYANCSEA